MRQEEREIGGVTYRAKQFGAKRGLEVLGKVTKLLGGVLEVASGSMASDSVMMAAALGRVEPGQLVDLAMELSSSVQLLQSFTSQAGPQVTPIPLAQAFDTHFVDRYDELLELVVWVLILNFEKSLTRGKEQLGARLRALAPSLSPSTSTGASSGS
jgi:hypothetical protein